MRRCVCGLLMAGFLAMAGCGGGAEGGKPVFSATGKVTLFGAPLSDATVAFAPTAQGQPTAIGRTDKDGIFVLTTYEYGDGAAEGTFKVVISKPMPTKPTSSSASGGEGGGHEADYATSTSHDAVKASKSGSEVGMVPPEYGSSSTTSLKAEVKSGAENDFLFEIE